ncbi:MAG: YggT family protein [Actinomycetales bacterium]|nr:YggT family protein [Actinomycetales bacterium]
MTIFGQVLAKALLLYWLLFIFRLVFDFVQIFARSWRPQGPLLVLVEALYTVTDPPLRLIRRFIPPLRLGRMQFDVAFLLVLVALQILSNAALML